MKKKLLGLGIVIVVIAALAGMLFWPEKEDVADIGTAISEQDTVENDREPHSTQEAAPDDGEEPMEQSVEADNALTEQTGVAESEEADPSGNTAESEQQDTPTDSNMPTNSDNSTNSDASTKPNAPSKPDAPTKPENSGNPSDTIVVTTNSGVEIPVLQEFNQAGLNGEAADDDMQDWFGYVGDSNSPGYIRVNECADAMNELTEAMEITGGFLPLQEAISFSFTDMYASVGDLVLRRDFENGYYTIGINYDMSDAESFYPVEDGKDALTLLCSVVSSTPVELAEFLYEESFVAEECMTSEDTWVAVGDCQVQWGGYNGNESDELVYKIRGLQ